MDTLAELWNRNARYNGDRLATVVGDRRTTFKVLFYRATRLGNALAQFGLRKHDRVAMLAMNRHEWFEVYGACHLSAFIVASPACLELRCNVLDGGITPRTQRQRYVPNCLDVPITRPPAPSASTS